MITKTMAILIALALALASAQPVVTDQPTADPKPTPTPNYECLTEPVDWNHIPLWDICPENHWSDPR